MNDRELLWKQYEQNISLFRFYMELLVKLSVFHYAVTGAIISFVLVNSNSNSLIKFALLLPLVMSVSFAGFFIYGAVLANVLRRETFQIRDAFGLRAAPDIGVLSVVLILFSIIYVLTAIGCGVLLCKI